MKEEITFNLDKKTLKKIKRISAKYMLSLDFMIDHIFNFYVGLQEEIEFLEGKKE